MRGRCIGELSSVDVESLRVQGHLCPLGTLQPQRLIWSGPAPDPADLTDLPGAVGASQISQARGRAVSMLARVLAGCGDACRRRRLAVACLTWRNDHKALDGGSVARGMNWSSILAGTRIDSVSGSLVEPVSPNAAAERLARIRASFTVPETERVLQLVLLEGASRNRIAREFGRSSRWAEQAACRALETLAGAYDRCVSRPGQFSPTA